MSNINPNPGLCCFDFSTIVIKTLRQEKPDRRAYGLRDKGGKGGKNVLY
jgi:hypothetical protein